MPPPCHSANTPGASGAAATSISVNGRLLLVIDMVPPPTIGSRHFTPAVQASTAMAPTCRIVSTRAKRSMISAAYCGGVTGIRVAEEGLSTIRKRRANMPLKLNGALCHVREQIIEDAASGLILQFECDDGRLRIVLAGKTLSVGNREILFDE